LADGLRTQGFPYLSSPTVAATTPLAPTDRLSVGSRASRPAQMCPHAGGATRLWADVAPSRTGRGRAVRPRVCALRRKFSPGWPDQGSGLSPPSTAGPGPPRASRPGRSWRAEPDAPDAYGGLGTGGSGLGRPRSAELQGLTRRWPEPLVYTLGQRRYSPVLPVGPTTNGRPSMFSQPAPVRILGMEVLLGVELCVLTAFVLYGWGPEGYRTWRRRKQRRRSRVSVAARPAVGARPSVGARPALRARPSVGARPAVGERPAPRARRAVGARPAVVMAKRRSPSRGRRADQREMV
jgi:hypothetical protein